MVLARRAVLGTGLAVLARGARAEGWPERAVRLVVPFTAGGPTDLAGRIIATDLGVALGQSVIVDNRGGAGGNIGAADVAKARGDGYTLLLATAGVNAINRALYKRLAYDHLKDFRAVAMLSSAPNLFLAHPSLGVTDMAGLVARAKQAPGQLQVAMAGFGTTQHMTAELLKVSAGIDFAFVPYKGGAQAMTDLLGGHVQLMVDSVPTALQHIRAGSIRGLGISSLQRSAVLPDVPTVAETLPGFEALAWWGIAAPTSTPDAVVERLNREVNRLLGTPAVQARYADLGADPRPMTPAAFDAYIRAETVKWAGIVTATGAHVE